MSYNLLTQTPINVSVDGFSSYAVIVWLAEDTAVNECEGRVNTPIPFSQKIYIDPLNCGSQINVVTGTIESSLWGGNRDVTYRITQLAAKDCDCDPYAEKAFCPLIEPSESRGDGGLVKFKLTTSHSYGIISSITMPYYLESNATATTFSVTYYDSFINDCGTERVFTAVTTIEVNDDVTDCDNYGVVSGYTNINTIDGGYTFEDVYYEFYHMRPSSCGCQDGTTNIFGQATYIPSVVPYSGASVQVTKPYIEVTIKDCIETRVSKVSSYTINVGENTTCEIIYDVNNEVGLRQLYDQTREGCVPCSDNHDVWYDIHVVKVMDAEPYTIVVDYDEIVVDGNDVGCDCNTCPTIVPNESSGSGGHKRFDFTRGGSSEEWGGSSIPSHMMPYYGGIAYARVALSAYSLNEDCERVSSVTEVIIPIEVEPIDKEDCNPEVYMCNSYEVVYGINPKEMPDSISSWIGRDYTINRDVACIAQSTDCERGSEGCDSDDFTINPTTYTTYCDAVVNARMATFHSMCIRPSNVSAFTDSSWIHLIGVDQSTSQLIGYSIFANIDQNANTTNDRVGIITVKHNYLGIVYSTNITVTQQKCNLNCNCGSMLDDVPLGSNEETNGNSYISAHTELSYSGNTNSEALWVYHTDKGCYPTYCVNPNDGTVYDDSNNPYPNTDFNAVFGKVTDNEDPNNERTLTVALSFKDNCNEICDINGQNVGTEITQSRFVCDCEKLDNAHSFMLQNVPSNGETDPTRKLKIGEISTYKGASGPICAKHSKITCEQDSSEESIVGAIEVSTTSNGTNNGIYTSVDVKAVVRRNATINERTFTILVSNEGEQCFSLVGKQEAMSCSCADVTFSDVGSHEYDQFAHEFTAFTYSIPSEKAACEEKVSQPQSTNPSMVSVAKVGNAIKCSLTENQTLQSRSATISISVDGGQCHTFEIRQEPRCPIYTITPSNTSGEGGNKTFTLTFE